MWARPLTIVGGVRERWVFTRRGRRKTVCARGAWAALLRGPSTSPLEVALGDLCIAKSGSALRLPPWCFDVGCFGLPCGRLRSVHLACRVRQLGASSKVGARANADSRRSSRTCALRARRRSPLFPAQWRAYPDTMSSSLAAAEPHAHSAVCGATSNPRLERSVNGWLMGRSITQKSENRWKRPQLFWAAAQAHR